LIRRLAGPQNRSKLSEEEITHLPLLVFEPLTAQPVSYLYQPGYPGHDDVCIAQNIRTTIFWDVTPVIATI
jgi:hypothetical protein